ncbi:hypothetical protein KPH14_007473 [Odynerus spinipes]|uniref:Zinc finger CHCC-type domain-containing protein n=1 Tax=Odynerus spinipes TaxID=1348599 RepID=A0AAD9RAZ9_9HYME|nr:hypothetical protein KPH14_007473 [Odynerus spinipes]
MATKSVLRLLESSGKIKQTNFPVVSLTVRKYSSEVPDKVTHTGQKFEEHDYRLVRFVDRPKHVNPNWAITYISKVPAIPIKGRIVACDGGGGPLGHPKVYINLDKPDENPCGYCGLHFYKEDDH